MWGTVRPWARWAVAALAAALSGACGGPPGPDSDESPLQVRIVGEDFRWHIRYAGADGAMDTADDKVVQRDLYLPARTRIRMELRSADFIYSFNVPQYDVWEAAVPQVPMISEFETGAPARLALLGDQFCGFSHEDLLGQVVVQEPGAFRSWLKNTADSPARP